MLVTSQACCWQPRLLLYCCLLPGMLRSCLICHSRLGRCMCLLQEARTVCATDMCLAAQHCWARHGLQLRLCMTQVMPFAGLHL